MIGQKIGSVSEMFAPAKADFEMKRAILAKQALRRHWPLGGHCNLRKQVVDQLLLARAQGFANAAAVEPA